MNKYQEALDYVNKSVCTALSCLGVNDPKTKESLHTLQELVDKETPKKVKAEIMSDYVECHYVQSYEIYVCPVCGLHLSPTQNYCDRCSQKLDWSDEDDR